MLTDLKQDRETSFVHISFYSVVMVPQAAIIRMCFVARKPKKNESEVGIRKAM